MRRSATLTLGFLFAAGCSAQRGSDLAPLSNQAGSTVELMAGVGATGPTSGTASVLAAGGGGSASVSARGGVSGGGSAAAGGGSAAASGSTSYLAGRRAPAGAGAPSGTGMAAGATASARAGSGGAASAAGSAAVSGGSMGGAAGATGGGVGSAGRPAASGGSPSAADRNTNRLAECAAPTGMVSYTLAMAAMPSTAQRAAYDKITEAMDVAVSYYNCFTDIQKRVMVSYNPDVATADGSTNGSIRFGAQSSINHITAMHEIAHTVGIGSAQFGAMISNGIFTGREATAQLVAITGNPADQVHGDRQHFWPYGLNYTTEVKSIDDLINHCKLVVAIRKDLGQ